MHKQDGANLSTSIAEQQILVETSFYQNCYCYIDNLVKCNIMASMTWVKFHWNRLKLVSNIPGWHIDYYIWILAMVYLHFLCSLLAIFFLPWPQSSILDKLLFTMLGIHLDKRILYKQSKINYQSMMENKMFSMKWKQKEYHKRAVQSCWISWHSTAIVCMKHQRRMPPKEDRKAILSHKGCFLHGYQRRMLPKEDRKTILSHKGCFLDGTWCLLFFVQHLWILFGILDYSKHECSHTIIHENEHFLGKRI